MSVKLAHLHRASVGVRGGQIAGSDDDDDGHKIDAGVTIILAHSGV